MSAVSRLLAVLLAALGLGGGAAHSARVPAGVSSIRITAPDAAITVADPAEVHAIVKWFDALPPWSVRRCPRMDYVQPDVRFDFRDATGAVVLHAVDQAPNVCGGSIAYGSRPPLADDGFLTRVSQLVGVDFDPNARTKQNETAAKLDEAMLLDRARVPAGSRLVAESRTTRTWRVHMPPEQVMAWEQAHRPRGAAPAGADFHWTFINDGEVIYFPPIRGQVSSRTLEFFLSVARDGWTRIHVSANDTWIVARPTNETLSASVQTIEIRKGARLVHRVTAPGTVAAIARWFNALTVSQAGDFPLCAGRPPLGPTETLTFLDGSGRVLLSAWAAEYGSYTGGCYPLHASADGHTLAPLDGRSFLIRVERLLR